ncbi:SGNH/GDSL hydrolase family protein [Massilia norwichensis]|uniref:SGNH/GDSL hydrolase family protein n=1 Tax=Massilia norwichensis TaxID=1442366 RepID=A0ABT2A2I0_9BURK|nr:SGNH/GDSL hydrolase family protein [Massilia norwichensis]MCS0588401.1 SGNH/GDSL hydrolase family protein [Massilia norwichensis]
MIPTDDNAPPSQPRRGFLRTGPLLAAALTLPAALPAQAADRWTATWGAAPAGPPPTASTLGLSGQTLRLIVHASVAGSRVRIRISNEMGSVPLNIGVARIALRSSGAVTVAGTDRQLLFGGRSAVTIPAGGAVLSDGADFNVPPFADLAVSLYLPGTVRLTTLHNAALQTSYVSSAGDRTALQSLPIQRSIASWPFLTEVDVSGPYSGLSATNAVVALGDSLTDGQASSANANRRWPDMLARRLQLELGVAGSIGVANRGISANSLLKDYPDAMLAGQRALLRFERDVAATSGVRWMVVLIGINDIVYSSGSNPIPVDSLVNGHQQLIAKARARGIRPIGATLPPFEGHTYYTAARENVRKRFNEWMRGSGAYDAVVDFDLALRDPARPTRLRAAYDSGDHLHPNDAGYAAMAQAVPLNLFAAG